ncbi:TPA: hypothetical protein ACGN8S_005157 [Bacillus cereus]
MYNNLLVRERIKFITLSELRKEAQINKGSPYSQHYYKADALISFIDKNNVIDQEEERLFYPQNLGLESREIKLFFFSNDVIKICEIHTLFNVSILNISTKEVKKLELYTNEKSGRVELVIHIKDERPIKLSNGKDTSASWRDACYDLIFEIYALLNRQV